MKGYTPRYLAEGVLTTRAALEGERKLVTVVFCDLVNSTGLAERAGPESMFRLIERFFELAIARVHRYEGTINQFLGDGFMALFGAPVAHEDHARRAVIAALNIRRAVADERFEGMTASPQSVTIRMGLHTGYVVTGKLGDNLRMDYTAIGDTTNLAARLQQIAEPGSIYLSASTYRLVSRYVECDDLGERTVKNRQQSVHVYRALRAKTRPAEEVRRKLTVAIVGRQGEIARLQQQVRALQAGQGGLVLVVGDAGLGKSRLLAEVTREVAATVTLLEGQAVSFGGKISYWPFIEILKGYAGITDDDNNDSAWRKLARVVDELFLDEADDVSPYLGSFLALELPGTLEKRVEFLDAEAMGRQVLLTMRRFFERLGMKRPLLLIIEDLHWMDESSLRLMEHLLPLVERLPILFCCTSRPEPVLLGRLRAMARARCPERHGEIALWPLSWNQMSDLVRRLVTDAALPGPLLAAVLRKAEGNPFFVEEVIASLIDSQVLVWDSGAGEWRTTRSIDEIAIPDNIQGAIMARVDGLEQDTKELLKTASVVGRNFLYRIVRAVAGAQADLDSRLGELVMVDLLREARNAQELEYWFKHALVQQVTYDSILSDRRKRLHLRVARSIEELFPERLDEFYGLLALHFTRAEAWEKAQEYLIKAGDQAGRLAGNAEALVHYRQAFDAYVRTSGDKWDVRQRAFLKRRIGETLFRRGEHEEAIEYLQGALEDLGVARLPEANRDINIAIVKNVARQITHRLFPRIVTWERSDRDELVERERVRVYETMGWIDFFRLPKRMFLDSLLLINCAERIGLSQQVACGLAAIGIFCDLISLKWIGGYYQKQAVMIAEGSDDPIALGYSYLGLGMHRQLQWDWESAIALYRRSAAEFKRAGHLRGWGWTASAMDWLLFLRGDFAGTREGVDEVVRIGKESADHQVLGWGLMDSGMLEISLGAYDHAVEDLERAIELFEGVPDYQSLAVACGYLGQGHLHRNEVDKALEALGRGEQLNAKYGFRGPVLLPTVYGLALTFLTIAETAEPQTRWMKRAKRACAAARRLGRHLPDAYVMGCRLQGTYEWLRGRPDPARQWWLRSVAAAQRLGALYELGLTYLEAGRRLGVAEDLQRAHEIFTSIGAQVDRERAGRLLREMSLHRSA